jgi:hypothetical protein
MSSRRVLPFLILSLAALLVPPSLGAEPPAGTFRNGQCVTCHTERSPELVAGWKRSAHARTAPKADCVGCHGKTHEGAAARARRDETCVACHEKRDRASVHSYATSKHAVIVKLGQKEWDWSQPLARGNYRAPGCAYCHLHAGEHDIGKSVSRWEASAATEGEAPVRQRTVAVCGDCHAPRYVAEQLATGTRMLEFARMKLREARDVAERHREALTEPERAEVARLLLDTERHARNVRIGSGHQSPDYQWWHGHPALDGDLLRIKGIVSERERRLALPR